MGVDIEIYVEKKVNGKWAFFMPRCNFSNSTTGYCHPFDIGGRSPILFQILSNFYEDNRFGKSFETISDNRGIPADVCEETKWYMEDLCGCSYATLKEIMNFPWNSEIAEEYGKYKNNIPKEFFSIVVQHMQSALSEKISDNDVRIVFGYSI